MERIEPDVTNFNQAEIRMHPNICSFAKGVLEEVMSGEYEGVWSHCHPDGTEHRGVQKRETGLEREAEQEERKNCAMLQREERRETDQCM